MGVRGLWLLLSACGRRVSLESLRQKKLAVDLSIWLHQFAQYQQPSAETSKEQVLKGLMRRIVQLLWHQIRPVFVFDGKTPLLKQKTVQRRNRMRRQREQHSYKKTAQRLFLQQIKQKKKQHPKQHITSTCSDDDNNQQLISDSPTQYDRILQFRQRARAKYIPLAGNPQKYSQAQLDNFLQLSAFKQQQQVAFNHPSTTTSSISQSEVDIQDEEMESKSEDDDFDMQLATQLSQDLLSKPPSDIKIFQTETLVEPERHQSDALVSSESKGNTIDSRMSVEKRVNVSSNQSAEIDSSKDTSNLCEADSISGDFSVSFDKDTTRTSTENEVPPLKFFQDVAKNSNSGGISSDDSDIEWETVKNEVNQESSINNISNKNIPSEMSEYSRSVYDNGVDNELEELQGDYNKITKQELQSELQKDADSQHTEVNITGNSISINDEITNVDTDSNSAKDLISQSAFDSAIKTASNLTQWAGSALRKAVKDYIPSPTNSNDENQATQKLSEEEAHNSNDTNEVCPNSFEYIDKKNDGGGNTVLEVVEDAMELLDLFGVPYLVSPMEAEAQCAKLEQLGLVDGTITNDSDIFAFGGKNVYKNIFMDKKYVEAFKAEDIEQELGFCQDDMISLALLLGSDYTEGIHGIGIVNATEIINAFPGERGLHDFKEWVNEFNAQEELDLACERKSLPSEILDSMTALDRFKYSHRSIRRKWDIGDAFPNKHVIKAYKFPEVNDSSENFEWSMPKINNLTKYCEFKFGWDSDKTSSLLAPLLSVLANKDTQTRIDSYFSNYNENIKYAKIKSKRLRNAVRWQASDGQNSGTSPKKRKKLKEKEKA